MSVWHAIVYCSCLMLFVCPTVRAQYYSICSDLGYSNIDIVRSSGFILVGSGETENSTSYKPNLQCQRLVLVPSGWTLAVKARYEELELYRDYLRVFDGGYEASHVDEITPFDFKLRAAHTTGNSLLLSFTSDSSNIQPRKGFLLEIWANYTSSPTCNCQAIHNGETMCDFKKGTVSKGERFKSCEIKCDSGTIITRSDFFQNNIDETMRCNLNNGQWLRKEVVGLHQATDFLETPVQCENHTVPRKMLAQYSFKYANNSCSFVNSSFEEIRVHVIEAINSTSLPTEGVCFSETKTSGCSLESLELSCEDISTGSENETKLTLRIRDQLAKPMNVTGADFVALRGAFSSLTSKIEKYFRLEKFSVTRGNATVKATRFKHEDSLGLCPSPQVYINAPIFQGACTYCSSGYEYRSDPCLYNRCTHKCVKCSKGTPCFASAALGSHSDCNMKCPLGKGYNQTLGFCDWCPYDTYQNYSSTPQASCVKCPLHKCMTPYVGAASEADCMQPCTAGEYVVVKKNVPPECKPCPIGTYMNISVPHMERQCKKCPTIKPITQGNGSTKADDCIEKCPAGKLFNVSAKQCEECDKNTYQDEQGRFTCKNCPPGNVTVGPGKKGVRYCFSPCATGTFVNLAVNPIRCDRCSVGTFQDQKNHEKQECKSCGVHKTTNITGAINATQCFWVCVQGEFYNLTSQQCEKCTRGTYQDERAQETCKLCPDGKVTLHLGSKTLSGCIPSCGAGKYMDHKNQGRCLDCSIGTYQDRVNNSDSSESCLKCPDLKTTTAAKGADNVSKCVPYCVITKRCENGGTCANKDGGYTCVCANGLEGSHCELIIEVSKAENVTFNLTVTSLKWKEELRDPNSDEFRETAEVVEDAVRSELRNDNSFRAVRVRVFSKGSVVTEFDVSYIPDNSSGMPVAGLTKAVAAGQVGGLTVVNDSLAVVSYTCQQPLGMEDGRIKDGWITASTSRADEWPWHARLNNPSHVGWCDIPGSIRQPYLQIDFNRRVVITGVATQGKLGSRFVKSYKLAFTNNKTFWQIYPNSAGQEKEFSGNLDNTTVVKHNLPNPVPARFLRFLPKDYQYQICLRVEVYGCTLPQGTTATIKPTLPSLPVAPTHEPLTLYTGTTATSTSQASVTTSLVTPGKKDNKTGAIVGAVIAVLLFVFIVALVIYCCHRKKIAFVEPDSAGHEPMVKLKIISYKKHEDDDFVAVL